MLLTNQNGGKKKMEDQAYALRNRVNASAVKPVGGRLRCIAVGSGKGGVGKTVVSVGMGYCLAKSGFRVLILDADMGLANVDLQVGIEPQFTLQDVVFGRSSLEEAVIDLPSGPSILAAASGAQEMVNMGGARRQMFVEELVRFAGRYEYLIIDAAAGIGEDVTAFLSSSPEALVVVANEPTSLMDAYALIKTLVKNPNPPVLSVVINMVKTVEEGVLLAEKLDKTVKRFLGINLPVAGIIPEYSWRCYQGRKPVPVSLNCRAAHALGELAKQVSSGRNYMRVGTGLINRCLTNWCHWVWKVWKINECCAYSNSGCNRVLPGRSYFFCLHIKWGDAVDLDFARFRVHGVGHPVCNVVFPVFRQSAL